MLVLVIGAAEFFRRVVHRAYALRMNEDSPDTVLDDDALRALLDRPLTELTVDELMALKDAYAARGIRICNSVPWEVVAPVLTGAAIYSKAFLETLAKHHADALNDALRARVRKDGKTIAFLVRADGDAIAKFVVVGDLPDAARVALRNPDVIAEALRGKILWWDEDAMAWRADSADD